MITVGREIAKLYAELGDYPFPSVVYNTPLLADCADVPRLRAQIGLPVTTPLVVFTGRVHGQGRGLDLVARALAELPDVHLAVLGQRFERYDQWLLAEARDAGIDDRLHLLPPVPPDRVVGSIRDADVALCLIQDIATSYRYCMPNKLLEAAFAGVPLVVSDLPELKAFVTKIGNGVVVDQTSPNAIAQGISEILETRERFVSTPEQQALLEDEYSWGAQQQRLEALYCDLSRG